MNGYKGCAGSGRAFSPRRPENDYPAKNIGLLPNDLLAPACFSASANQVAIRKQQ